MDATGSKLGVDLAMFVAATTAAAGVVHLALAPARAEDHAALGVSFALAGAVQLVAAGLALRRRAARLWPMLALGTTVLVGLWLAGHVIGLPIGPRSGAREAIHAVDAAVLGFELLTVVGAAIIHLRPADVAAARSGHHVARNSLAGAALVALCTVAVLVAPGALDAPGEDDPPGTGGSAAVPPPSTRGPRIEGLEDRPGATLALPGSPAPQPGTGGSPSTTVDASSSTAAVGDDGFVALLGGRREVPDEPMDRATRTALAEQLAATAPLLTAYPTIAAAEAAGYRRAGPFAPGTGTPYAPPRPPGNVDGRMDAADLADAVLLYDGTAPGSRLAGFLYLSVRAQTDGAPEGFAGPNDRWTFLTNICTVPLADARLAATPLGIDRSVSARACAAAGGSLLIAAYYALHVWAVPGYDSGAGVFRDVNASITCPDATYRTKPIDELGASATLCRG